MREQPHPSCPPRPLGLIGGRPLCGFGVHRRKEVTMERKKAAEERRRLEEEKAKVRIEAFALLRGRGMLI